MFTRTLSATHFGLDGTLVEIEVSRQKGQPNIAITGLAGDVIRESRERIRACLQNLGFDAPSSRLLVHLSPAQAKKQGSQLDLAIAVGILQAEGMFPPTELSQVGFVGEIALDGKIRSIPRALPLLECLCESQDAERVYVSRGNAFEAQAVGSPKLRLVDTLSEVLADLAGHDPLPTVEPMQFRSSTASGDALDRIVGQSLAKRAMEIAVAGRHHLLLAGSPGVGKSSLAECAPTLFPELTAREARDVLKIHGQRQGTETVDRPFRSPHHSISGSALLGGGSGIVIPGEVTLAHHGVLFLDEFPLFRRDLLEGLREPMQTQDIHLHRIGHSLRLPAGFLLLAAMNPCPCGFWGDRGSRCLCPADRVAQYQQRLSGPILERIDLFVFLSRENSQLNSQPHATAAQLRERIRRASQRQQDRVSQGIQTGWNAGALVDLGKGAHALDAASLEWVGRVADEEKMSLRTVHKWMRIARTLADLEERSEILREDLLEAKQLRCRNWWRVGYGR